MRKLGAFSRATTPSLAGRTCAGRRLTQSDLYQPAAYDRVDDIATTEADCFPPEPRNSDERYCDGAAMPASLIKTTDSELPRAAICVFATCFWTRRPWSGAMASWSPAAGSNRSAERWQGSWVRASVVPRQRARRCTWCARAGLRQTFNLDFVLPRLRNSRFERVAFEVRHDGGVVFAKWVLHRGRICEMRPVNCGLGGKLCQVLSFVLIVVGTEHLSVGVHDQLASVAVSLPL